MVHDTTSITKITNVLESFSCRNCISLHKSHTCIAESTRKKRRSNVLSACIHCKEAHTACDVSRPCSRCISLNMTESCQDTSQKKRGRPKRQEKTPADTDKAYTTKEIYSKETQLSSQKIYKEQPLFTKPIPSQKTNDEQQQALIDPTLSQNTYNDQQASLIVNSKVDSLLEQQHLSIASSSSTKKELSIILSMNIDCIHVPKDIYALWGYQSSELINRSLYDFVLKKDIDRLLEHHLLDHVHPLSDNKKLDRVHIRKKSGEYEPFELTTYREDDQQVIVAKFRSYKTNREERIPRFNMAAGTKSSSFNLTHSSYVTRPAHQYYLETLSSKLSVEASVLKSHNELSPYRYSQGPLLGPCKKSDMSINSLLC